LAPLAVVSLGSSTVKRDVILMVIANDHKALTVTTQQAPEDPSASAAYDGNAMM